MLEESTETTTWYLKLDGRVRGPFPRATLASMLQRGRITPDTEISPDRAIWMRLFGLGAEFSGPSVSTGAMIDVGRPGSGGLAGQEIQCFFSVDGQRYGPIPLSFLQARIAAGALGPTDPVWIEGETEWREASQLPGLTFEGRKKRASDWFRANPALASCLVLLAIVLFVVPTWYVVGLAKDREQAIEARIAAAKEEQAKREQQQIDGIARLAKAKDALDAREERLLAQRNQVQMQLETVRLQYTTLQLGQIQDNKVQQRLAELSTQQEQLDTSIQQLRGEQKQAAEEHAREVQRLQRIQEEGNRAAQQAQMRREDQNREQHRLEERQLEELEKQTREMRRRGS